MLILLLLTAAAHAQLPEAPAAQTLDKPFALVTALNAAATFADLETTRRALAGGQCVELDPLVGRHPSTLKLYGGGVALLGATVALSYELKKHRAPRWLWIAPQAISAGAHGYGAVYNRNCL